MKKFQVAWDEALVDRVDASAALQGLSRGEWLRLAASHVLQHRVKLVLPSLPVASNGCQHPKEKRVTLPYANLCGECRHLI